MKQYVVISEFYLNDSKTISGTFNNIDDAITYRDIMQRNLHQSKYHNEDGVVVPDYKFEVYEQILRK